MATEKKFFTPESVMEALGPHFLDEARCSEWVLKSLHPGEPRCPGCNTEVSERTIQRFWAGLRVKCSSCHKYFTAMTGTFLQGTHMSFREVFLLAVLIQTGIPSSIVAMKTGNNEETVRIWRRKFKRLKELSER